jgi:peroxiredoxin
MVRVASTMLSLQTPAPDFRLPDAEGRVVSLRDFHEFQGLLVMFVCNHCPFVRHVAEGLAGFAREYWERGIGVVAVNSNDAQRYPADAPARMAEFQREHAWDFPYLVDEDQTVAKAYRAACTPDYFLFDGERRLVYRGRFDSSSPGRPEPVTGADLRAAANALLHGREIAGEQLPSAGCNIKWKPGREPEYFPG